MKGGSASVTSEQTSGGGLWDAFGETLWGHNSKRVHNVFKLCCNKVIHVHAGRTGSVLFAQAENIMGTRHVLSEPSSASSATRSWKDVGSLSRFGVVGFTTAKENMG